MLFANGGSEEVKALTQQNNLLNKTLNGLKDKFDSLEFENRQLKEKLEWLDNIDAFLKRIFNPDNKKRVDRISWELKTFAKGKGFFSLYEMQESLILREFYKNPGYQYNVKDFLHDITSLLNSHVKEYKY